MAAAPQGTTAKQLIDSVILDIVTLLTTDRSDATVLFYSSGPDGRSLGTGIFQVAPVVCHYIADAIWSIPAQVRAKRLAAIGRQLASPL